MLVVVKAYPVIDQESMNEAVCVAGISIEKPRRWIRLFPLDFRGLEPSLRFKKYDIIELEAVLNRRDHRPESMTPNIDSISVVGSMPIDRGSWQARLDYLDEVEVDSMCGLIAQQRIDGTSLGIFKPKHVSDVIVEEQSAAFTASQESVLAQPSLLGGRVGDGDRIPLKPLPLKFKYRYICNRTTCPSHRQTIIDWELGRLFQRLRDEGLALTEIKQKVRSKFLKELAGPGRDLRFIVGTMRKHPSFIVIGVASPVAAKQQQSERLFYE